MSFSSSILNVATEGKGDSSSHESMSLSSPSPLQSNEEINCQSTLRLLPLEQAVEFPEEINVEGFNYAVSSKKSPRIGKLMEDTHKAMPAKIFLPAEDSSSAFRKVKASFFGVFDGHGGWKAADFAAENIGHNILDALLQEMGEQLKLSRESDSCTLNKDDLLSKKNLEQAVRAGYLKTDEEFLEQGISSGSTCVTALIINGNLVVSNAGDSRAVISIKSRDTDGVEGQALTCDHKPGREDESKRIEELGGFVSDFGRISRVGPMAVSRGIGDRFMKRFVSAEPETRVIEITSDCEFIILASDGLWDVVTNQEAVDIARPFFCEEENGGGLLRACKKLVEVAIDRKSRDDITVMIVRLQDFCKDCKMI